MSYWLHMPSVKQSSSQPLELYPLDVYVESRIGSVDFYSTQWNSTLIDVVATYLTSELPDDRYKAFLANLYSEAPPEGIRQEQVQFILAHHDPFDLHGVSHDAAVATAPKGCPVIGLLGSPMLVAGFSWRVMR